MGYVELCEVIRGLGNIRVPEDCHYHVRFIPAGTLTYRRVQLVFMREGTFAKREIWFKVEIDHVPTGEEWACLNDTLRKAWAR
jgi:hypothetical protein